MTLFDILFLLAWFVIPFLWLYTLKIGSVELTKLSIPSFLIIFIFIFQYLGYPILYFKLDDYRADFVVNQNILLIAWIITSITTFLLSLGVVMGCVLLGRLRFFKLINSEQKTSTLYGMRRIYAVGFLSIFVLYFYISKIGLSNIALIAAFSGDSQLDIALKRSLMGNDFGPGYHWFNFFMRDVLTFISLIFIGVRFQKSEQISIIVLITFNILVVFSLTMATEKGLLIDYIIAIFIVYCVIKKKGVLPLFLLSILVTSIILSLILLYIFFMGDSSFIQSISSIVSRVLTGSIQPVYHYLNFFPAHQDWLYGSSFPNPGGILPFTPYNLAMEVMNFVHPDDLVAGIVGSMPAIYWGELYANFGYYGFAVFPLLIGFGLYVLNWILFKLYLDPVNASLFAWTLLHYKNLSITGLSSFLVDLNLLMLLITYFLIKVRVNLR